MPTILLEIAPLAGSLFDGATFRAASFFAFAQVGANHFTALAPAAGAVGVVDPRELLEALENQFRNVIDKDSTEAQNPSRVTDIIMERAIIQGTGLTDAPTLLASHTPPLPGSATGVRDQVTPNGRLAVGLGTVKTFGGSGFLSTAIAGVRGGYVTIPTRYQLGIASDGTNPRALLWLLPIYSCCCAAEFLSRSEAGAEP